MRFLLLLLMTTLFAIEVPDYVMIGILKVESSSYYRENGTIKYIDMTRGKDGERGCFQMKRIAFNQIKRKGEQFWMIEQDKVLAEDCARRYLVWLYENSGHQDWSLTIQRYKMGPSGRSQEYLEKVLVASNK
jgi:hypothetical protein